MHNRNQGRWKTGRLDELYVWRGGRQIIEMNCGCIRIVTSGGEMCRSRRTLRSKEQIIHMLRNTPNDYTVREVYDGIGWLAMMGREWGRGA